MLNFLPLLLPVSLPTPAPLLAQNVSHQYIYAPQEVRPLPGQLDEVPVFNSNSPEVVQQEGILLSTFDPDGMRVPSAHLNYAFDGRFDIFIHHIARGRTPDDVRTLYVGVLIHNPSDRSVTIEVPQAVSYLSQEAPFYDLPAYVSDNSGNIYAGPGSRTTTDILRGVDQGFLPDRFRLPPGSTQLLFSAPIPLRDLQEFRQGMPLPLFVDPSEESGLDATSDDAPASDRPIRPRNRDIPINGRTALIHMESDGPVNVASLGMFSHLLPDGREAPPSLDDWLRLLEEGDLAGPRDIPPTPPNQRTSMRRFYYGRVSGVAQGSVWQAQLTDPDSDQLSIPEAGQSISYAISTVDRNTLSTGQIQSAPMLVRYPDTAYRAHGNYGIRYQLSLPLHNSSDRTQQVALLFQTPLKDETLQGQGLRFISPPVDRVFYRGTLRLSYTNDWGTEQTRYIHVVQRRGQQGEPLITLSLRPGEERNVDVEFLYPPDATPPQALTVETLAPNVIPRPNPDQPYPTLSTQSGVPTSSTASPPDNSTQQ